MAAAALSATALSTSALAFSSVTVFDAFAPAFASFAITLSSVAFAAAAAWSAFALASAAACLSAAAAISEASAFAFASDAALSAAAFSLSALAAAALSAATLSASDCPSIVHPSLVSTNLAVLYPLPKDCLRRTNFISEARALPLRRCRRWIISSILCCMARASSGPQRRATVAFPAVATSVLPRTHALLQSGSAPSRMVMSVRPVASVPGIRSDDGNRRICAQSSW